MVNKISIGVVSGNEPTTRFIFEVQETTYPDVV